jgi:alpha-1,2-mannosyltransferase
MSAVLARARPATRAAGVDWRRLAGRCTVAAVLILALVQLCLQARGRQYGIDFRGGTWAAGRALLDGRSPFPTVIDPAYLRAHPNSFITPPVLALLGAPFAVLPFGVAIVSFNLLCLAGLLLALRVLDVRDRGFALIVLGSFPFVASLALGQPDALFALGAAAAWRWRGSDRGAVATGVIIAAKLLAWPLVVWLLVTRRFRHAAVAAGAATALLLATWSTIGFDDLGSYPQLLAADARAFGGASHSFLTALARSGVPWSAASTIGVSLAVTVAAAVVLASRGSDLGWFTGALTLGILSSPIVWQHYFLLLFVAMAATRRVRDPIAWACAVALWLSPAETPATVAQAWLIPLLASTIALRIATLSRVTERCGAGGLSPSEEPAAVLA